MLYMYVLYASVKVGIGLHTVTHSIVVYTTTFYQLFIYIQIIRLRTISSSLADT